MGELLLNLALILLASLGALYALGLIIVALIGPPTDTCDCGCGTPMSELQNLCSSECDQKCKDNNHYEWMN